MRNNHGCKCKRNNGVWWAPHDQEVKMAAAKSTAEPLPPFRLQVFFFFFLFHFFSDKLQLSLLYGGSHCTFNASSKAPTLMVSWKCRLWKAGHLLCWEINTRVVSFVRRNNSLLSSLERLKLSPVSDASQMENVKLNPKNSKELERNPNPFKQK